MSGAPAAAQSLFGGKPAGLSVNTGAGGFGSPAAAAPGAAFTFGGGFGATNTAAGAKPAAAAPATNFSFGTKPSTEAAKPAGTARFSLSSPAPAAPSSSAAAAPSASTSATGTAASGAGKPSNDVKGLALTSLSRTGPGAYA